MRISRHTPQTWLIFSIITMTITLIFAKCDSPADGNDELGFPFPFYQYIGGKLSVEPENRSSFNFIYLLFNLLIYFVFAYFFAHLIKRSKNNVH